MDTSWEGLGGDGQIIDINEVSPGWTLEFDGWLRIHLEKGFLNGYNSPVSTTKWEWLKDTQKIDDVVEQK